MLAGSQNRQNQRKIRDMRSSSDLSTCGWGEDNYYVVEIPVIPGCISQGKTPEEALANITEAAELCLENRKDEGWELRRDFRVEQIEIAV
jgi:predicted RNase H-like HicB family nuclease